MAGWLVPVALLTAAVVGLAAWSLFGGGGSGATAPTSSVEVGRTDGPPTTTIESASGDTFVITAPDNSVVGATLPDSSVPDAPVTAANGDRLVTDDTGFFTVAVPNDFEVNTASIDAGSVVVPSVKAAVDLAAFGDDYVTVGYAVNAVAGDLATSELDGIGLVAPGDRDCSTVSADTDIDTKVGPAVLQTFEGCGGEGGSVAVVALLDSASGRVFVVYAQGSNTVDSVTALATAVLESITVS